MILLYLHFKSQIMNIVFGLGMPGGWEWIIIGLIVVIFFGANKIPEINAKIVPSIDCKDTEAQSQEAPQNISNFKSRLDI